MPEEHENFVRFEDGPLQWKDGEVLESRAGLLNR